MGARRAGRPGRRRLAATATVVAIAAALGCTVATPPTPRGPAPGEPQPPPPTNDPALVSLSVMPPGNGNITGPTAAHLDDQRRMYDGLEDPVADGTLSEADLGSYFKDAGLGTTPTVRVDEPVDGVRVEWDAHGVPRVRGQTAEQVAWGAGWVVADTRLLIAEIGRLLGRAGTLEMGGSDIVGALAQLPELPQINYTDAELEAAMADAVAAAGDEGPRMLAAVDAFVDGLNHWLDTHTFPPELLERGLQWRHWTRADVLAVGIVVDDIFGSGGGDEVGNATALRALEDELGVADARATFDDLRTADAPDSTTHVEQTFPYPLFDDGSGSLHADPRPDPAAVALPDADVPTPEVREPTMSNYVALSGKRSASGHPILVGGPQSSYFAPQLLLEMELLGGGYDTRGITFPGLGPWVVIGRARDYAWTATAGGSDLADQRVELLCEPDGAAPDERSRHYVRDGVCHPMTRPDTGEMTAWRTVHGPVVGTGTVDGRPVAISRERMSRFQTAHAAPAFWALNRGLVDGAEDFAPTMSTVPMSFNWVYVDARQIATFHSGWYPVRASGVDPDLPSWGTGEWDWRGRVDWRDQPRSIDPASGVSISWNNRVAPGWREPDSDWSAGSVQRVDLLAERLEGVDDATPTDLVAAVQDAATADLRGAHVLPTLLELLDGDDAPTPQLAETLEELRAWQRSGAHRRDRGDDLWYDDHAVAVMDALWIPLLDTVFRPALGDALHDEVRRPRSWDNPPSLTGGAYAHGWYGQLVRDLERVMGERPAPAGVPVACGGGDLERCRDVVWRALELARSAAGPLPRFAGFERVRFLPLVFNAESVRWVNRPTFQQVVSFG